MKKIMMALGIVAVAAGVQAATYNWSVISSTAAFNGYDSTADIGKAWTGATATSGLKYYFFCQETISQGDLLTALRNGGNITDYAALASGTTGSDGKVAKKTFTADTSLVKSDGKMYSYFAILSPDEKSVFLSASTGLAADTSGGQSDYYIGANPSKILRDTDGTTAFGSAGWYSAAATPGPSPIPEPTSGLLMLLGVAGLALRRRRA